MHLEGQWTDANEAPVRMLEEQHGSPIVGFIFDDTTGRTGSRGANIDRRIHREIEPGSPSQMGQMSMVDGPTHSELQMCKRSALSLDLNQRARS